MSEQLPLGGVDRQPPTARERILAGTIAGFHWSGHGTFEGLSKKRQKLALAAARMALTYLQYQDDSG